MELSLAKPKNKVIHSTPLFVTTKPRAPFKWNKIYYFGSESKAVSYVNLLHPMDANTVHFTLVASHIKLLWKQTKKILEPVQWICFSFHLFMIRTTWIFIYQEQV